MSPFGDCVRLSREALVPEVSQRELARRLQARGIRCDHTALSRIESGETRRLEPGFIGALAEELGWTPEKLAEAMRLAEQDLAADAAGGDEHAPGRAA